LPATDNLDWVATIRQTLPTLGRVAVNLTPTYEFESLRELDGAFLDRTGIRGLVWDVDGTLTHRGGRELAPEVREPFERLRAVAELRHVVLSNCNDRRFDELADLFPGIPVLRTYRLEDGAYVCRVRCGPERRWVCASPSATEPRRSVRKPDAEPFRFALKELGLEAQEVAVVGDQYLTDVAGANLAGLRSIRIPTVGASSFPAAVRMLQVMDRVAGLMVRPGLVRRQSP
jgi:hypothetical protein